MTAAYIHGALPGGRPRISDDDVDEIAVWRLLDGSLHRPPTPQEIRAAVAHVGYRMPAGELAQRLGCTRRTVYRHRARRRAA